MFARDRAGSVAMAGYLLAAGAFLVVASGAGSTVLVPRIDGALPSPYERVATSLGLSTMAASSRAALQLAASALLTLGFVGVATCAWRGLLNARQVIVLAIVVNVAVLFAPILFSRDVYSYATYGRIVAVHGENPYLIVPSRFPGDPFASVIGDVWRDEPTVYGPAFTGLSALVAWPVRDPATEIIVFRLIAAGASLAILPIVRRISDPVDPERTPFALTVAGLTPVLPFLTVVGGHNDALVALASVGGLWLMAGRRSASGVVAWTLGTLVKLTGGIALLVGAAARLGGTPRGRRMRRGLEVVAIAGGTALVASMPFLTRDDPTLAQTRLADREGWISAGRALRDVVERLGRSLVPSIAGEIGPVAHALLLLGLTVAVMWVAGCAYRRAVARGWRSEEVGAATGVAILAALLLSPAGPPWYVVWVLPFVWLLRPATRAAALILATVQFLSLPVADADLFPEAFRTTARVADGILSPAAIVLLVVVLRDAIRNEPDFVDPALRPAGTTDAILHEIRLDT